MARLGQLLRSVPSSASPYCPDAADLIWLNFDPQAGREQNGFRPALVLSPRLYNQRARLCVLCPVTTASKGYPFEVPIPQGLAISGAVLADQVKSLSWDERGAQFRDKAPEETVAAVRGMIRALLSLS